MIKPFKKKFSPQSLVNIEPLTWKVVGHLNKKSTFNGVAADLALEQTYNKDVKCHSSGIVGITMNEKARANVSGIKRAIQKINGRHTGTFSKFEHPVYK